MPLTHKILHWVGGMAWVTVLFSDSVVLYNGDGQACEEVSYHHLAMGQDQYLKIPMGLSISANVFQREMMIFFDRLKYVLVWL